LTKPFVIIAGMTDIRPTPLELKILGVLWDKGPSTVRQLTITLNEQRETGYTTVLKMLQIMNEKGLVSRDESRRPQVYRARHTQQATQKNLVRDLLDRAFDGSVKALVMQALATRRSSPEEIGAIEELIDRIEQRKGRKP
jgi:predicted transcriptional regulator